MKIFIYTTEHTRLQFSHPVFRNGPDWKIYSDTCSKTIPFTMNPSKFLTWISPT